MGELFTHGRWVVKDGMEDEFVQLWQDLADWTAQNVEGTSWAVLVQDRDDSREFRSFGPWDSLEAIEAWRGASGFQERVVRLRESLASFKAMTMETVADVGTRS